MTDTEWTGEKCWALVETRLERSYADAFVKLADTVKAIREPGSYIGARTIARLQKRVINGSYAHDFEYWKRGAESSYPFDIGDEIEEELLDAIVYIAIQHWITDHREGLTDA